jgi:hypothetical protein
VGVTVGVFVAVLVAVAVLVGVLVAGRVPVGVFVGVRVWVGVRVTVGVRVRVGVAVGTGVAPVMVVSAVEALFASFDSPTMLFGSTAAVFEMTMSVVDSTKPVTVIVASALGPVPNGPRSQSSVPPVIPPVNEQMPRVVLKPV